MEFVLQNSVYNLLKNPDVIFNYSDLTDKKISLDRPRESKKRVAASKPQESSAMPLILPSRMRVRDGQLNVQTIGQTAVKINGIDLSLQEVSGRSSVFLSRGFQRSRLEDHCVGRDTCLSRGTI